MQKNFITANLEPAILSNQYIQPQFTVAYNNNSYELHCSVKLLNTIVPVEENVIASPLIFQHEQTFYLWQKTEDVLLAERFLNTEELLLPEKNGTSNYLNLFYRLQKIMMFSSAAFKKKK